MCIMKHIAYKNLSSVQSDMCNSSPSSFHCYLETNSWIIQGFPAILRAVYAHMVGWDYKPKIEYTIEKVTKMFMPTAWCKTTWAFHGSVLSVLRQGVFSCPCCQCACSRGLRLWALEETIWIVIGTINKTKWNIIDLNRANCVYLQHQKFTRPWVVFFRLVLFHFL